MKQSNKINNYQKLVDESVELVLFIDIQEDSYEVVHDAGRMVWNPQEHGCYTSFIKYIEKHIEEEDIKRDLQNLFAIESYKESKVEEEAIEKEYRITMQGGYEDIMLLRYQMEAIPGYEHTGILVVRLLTAHKEMLRRQLCLSQVAKKFCKMAVMVQLDTNQIQFLILPEYIKNQVMNLPKTFEGFVHELVERVHVQDQDVVKHILTRPYIESKLSTEECFVIQIRCKGEDEAFHDLDIVCSKTDFSSDKNELNFVLMLKNITEEKKLIEGLQKEIEELQDKLEEAKEEKEELCSMIAKELHKR